MRIKMLTTLDTAQSSVQNFAVDVSRTSRGFFMLGKLKSKNK
jgi:hypothetical protein